MHITCPKCAASYQVSVSAVGADGRSVRCVRCRTVWFQPPPAEVPPLAPSPSAPATRTPASDSTVAAFQEELGKEIRPPSAGDEAVDSATGPEVPDTPLPDPEPVEPTVEEPVAAPPPPPAAASPGGDRPPGAALSEIAVPAGEAPPTVPAEGDAAAAADGEQPTTDIESTAARRRKPRSHARRRLPTRTRRMPALLVLLVAACAALIVWRGSIVRHAPQMASLYAAIGMPVNLRGLVFSDVKVSRDIHEGVQVLTVEGVIISVASKPVEVPRLRFAMRNETGAEVYAWTALPSREVLAPGETLPFRSRLASPPGDGHAVMVRFFTRLDAVAGLR